jgi:hypothetical protein
VIHKLAVDALLAEVKCDQTSKELKRMHGDYVEEKGILLETQLDPGTSKVLKTC